MNDPIQGKPPTNKSRQILPELPFNVYKLIISFSSDRLGYLLAFRLVNSRCFEIVDVYSIDIWKRIFAEYKYRHFARYASALYSRREEKREKKRNLILENGGNIRRSFVGYRYAVSSITGIKTLPCVKNFPCAKNIPCKKRFFKDDDDNDDNEMDAKTEIIETCLINSTYDVGLCITILTKLDKLIFEMNKLGYQIRKGVDIVCNLDIKSVSETLKKDSDCVDAIKYIKKITGGEREHTCSKCGDPYSDDPICSICRQ